MKKMFYFKFLFSKRSSAMPVFSKHERMITWKLLVCYPKGFFSKSVQRNISQSTRFSLIDFKKLAQSAFRANISLWMENFQKKYFPFNKLFPFINKNETFVRFASQSNIFEMKSLYFKKSALGLCLNLSINILGKKLVFQSTCFNLICWKREPMSCKSLE